MAPNTPLPPSPWRFPDALIILLAQGFGSGRLPWGPGTWGSLIGVGWLIALLTLGSATVWIIANLAAVLGAVAICSRAEIVLGQHDPGSVVLDEIVAVPLTFLGPWIALGIWPIGVAGHPIEVCQRFWPELLVGFLAFRVFDIAKPGPIGRIQYLPAGWGVVADDVLAALAAAGVTGLVTFARLN